MIEKIKKELEKRIGQDEFGMIKIKMKRDNHVFHISLCANGDYIVSNPPYEEHNFSLRVKSIDDVAKFIFQYHNNVEKRNICSR